MFAASRGDMRPSIPLDRFEVFGTGLDHPEGLAFDRKGILWAGGEQGQLYRIDRKGRRLGDRTDATGDSGTDCGG